MDTIQGLRTNGTAVFPHLEYCVQFCMLQCGIDRLELVQKMERGMEDRLKELGMINLERRWFRSAVITVYKCCPVEEGSRFVLSGSWRIGAGHVGSNYNKGGFS